MKQINLTVENEKVEQDNLTIPKTEVETYEKPSVTVDNVIFSKDLRYVLLIKRGNDPFKDCYALPGGFVESKETILMACKRELFEETNIKIPNPKFSDIYSEPGRDPRGWTITIAYYTTVDKKMIKPVAGDDAREVKWVDVAEINKLQLAFDHNKIIMDAYSKAFQDKSRKH